MTAPVSSALQSSKSPGNDEFPELARQVREAGLFYRPPWRAGVRLGLVGVLYAAGWAALFVVGNVWYQLLIAVYLAAVFAQVGFLGHDAGHRQSFRSRRLNRAVGLGCGNLATGISYSYWVTKHAQHHAHPNQIGADPDVGPGVICWTPEQAVGKTGLSLAIAKHQGALFFPLTCLEAVNLHILSVRACASRQSADGRTEAILLSAHGVLYLGALLLALSPPVAVAFFVVQQGALVFTWAAPSLRTTRACQCRQQVRSRALYGAKNHGSQRQRRAGIDPGPRWAQLPDRAPSVPEYADGQPPPLPAHCPGVLLGPRHRLLRDHAFRFLPGWAEAPIADEPTDPRPCSR